MKPLPPTLSDAIRAANEERANQERANQDQANQERARQDKDKQESQISGQPRISPSEDMYVSLPVPSTVQDEYVQLCIRVHRRDRVHWLVETRKQGTSLKAAIEEALSQRFGKAEVG